MNILQKGFSVIEIIVASALISVAGIAIILSTLSYLEISSRNAHNVQTALLFEETAEAIQFLRDQSWDTHLETIPLNTPYYLEWDDNNYTLTTTPSTIDGVYTRTITFAAVERDGSDNITSNGTTDTNTLLATVTISWDYKGETQSAETEFLIHNTYDN